MHHRLLKWFESEHLREDLRPTVEACAALAKAVNETLPECPEKTAGLQLLVEAKDWFVRAKLTSDGTAAAETKFKPGTVVRAHSDSESFDMIVVEAAEHDRYRCQWSFGGILHEAVFSARALVKVRD